MKGSRAQIQKIFLWNLTLVAVMFCSACTVTNTINHTKEFAQAGITFTDSLDPVLDQSLEANIRANSLTLENGRKQLIETCAAEDDKCLKNTQNMLQDNLNDQIKKETQRVLLYRRFLVHAQVLRNYFQTLSSLATSDQPEALGQSANRLVLQASKLREAITESNNTIDLGDTPNILVKQVANTFKSKALQKVLKDTAPSISTELALQENLLDILAEQTSSDVELLMQVQDDENIKNPFIVSTKPLPANWADRRLAAARRVLDLNAVESARKAARSLRVAFEALAENRLDAASLGVLIQDLNNLATLALEVDRVRNLQQKGGKS